MTTDTAREECDQTCDISFVTEDDIPEIIDFLKTYFFKDEPMNTFLELGECKELEEYATHCITDDCSFKATNSKGEIIGVFLNGIIHKPAADAERSNSADECKHEKFKKILSLFDHIETLFNLFDLYPEYERALDGKILAVNSNYRGLGIAGKLTTRTIEYMQEHSIPLFHVMCSSKYSARVCEKLGFEEVFSLPFLDYVVNGENPLLPADPHTDIKIMTKRI
ncbi:dopamine N-acetyltransferase isoform X2 [Bradysia coprophila]|nr:dopamine N-acetyltransferase isoform X2 [Bradysia coprophila]XP_037035335.1 dopamine N-acetyltransferase isoform X2 [Bradysia coprophila]